MPTAKLPILYSFRRCPYAMRARLAKRKIATQNEAAYIGKSFSQGDQ